eukprot:g42093.t1
MGVQGQYGKGQDQGPCAPYGSRKKGEESHRKGQDQGLCAPLGSSRLYKAFSADSEKGRSTFAATQEEILETVVFNDGSPFSQVQNTLQVTGEISEAFSDRLWPVYMSTCGGGKCTVSWREEISVFGVRGGRPPLRYRLEARVRVLSGFGQISTDS